MSTVKSLELVPENAFEIDMRNLLRDKRPACQAADQMKAKEMLASLL